MANVLCDKLVRRWPSQRWSGLTVIVACSGGADSTALLLALASIKSSSTTLIAAHFNHRLRGQESDEDQQFVKDMAQRLSIECVVGDTNAVLAESDSATNPLTTMAHRSNASGRSDEAYLRKIRYAFLTDLAKKKGARYVAVAHTADDSVETAIHHWLRGTGVRGLAGIAPYRGLNEDLVLIRPLIDAWRSEVEDYLQSQDAAFRKDSSNHSMEYTRNRIRHRIIPVLENEYGSQVKSSIHRSLGLLREVQDCLKQLAEQYLDEHLVSEGQGRVLLRCPSVRVPWPIIQEAMTLLWQENQWSLQEMTIEHWHRLRDSRIELKNLESTFDLPGKIKVTLTPDSWLFEKGSDP
jgi:tRNA(Ile)-lysidine synthase